MTISLSSDTDEAFICFKMPYARKVVPMNLCLFRSNVVCLLKLTRTYV